MLLILSAEDSSKNLVKLCLCVNLIGNYIIFHFSEKHSPFEYDTKINTRMTLRIEAARYTIKVV